MADCQKDRSKQNRLTLTKIAIREKAPENRGDINKAGIGPVNKVRLSIRKQPMFRQIENKQSAHPIIGKTLPHFGEKQHEQAARMAK